MILIQINFYICLFYSSLKVSSLNRTGEINQRISNLNSLASRQYSSNSSTYPSSVNFNNVSGQTFKQTVKTNEQENILTPISKMLK